MAEESTKPKSSNTWLYLGAAGLGAYLLLGKKNDPTTDPNSWLNPTAAAQIPTGAGTTTTTASSSGAAPVVAPVVAQTTAPATPVVFPATPVDSNGNIYSDGAPHRNAGTDQKLTNWNDTDRGNIQTIVNYWNSRGGQLTVEDVSDIVSWQETQERKKGWNDVLRDYTQNPSWFQDKVREWNNDGGKYPKIKIPT